MALSKQKLDDILKVTLKKELDVIFGPAPGEGDSHRKKVCAAMSKAMSEVMLQHLLDNLEVVGVKVEVPASTYLKSASGGGGATGNTPGTPVVGEPELSPIDFSQFLEPEESLNPQGLVVGKVYTITKVGSTDFTKLGASENKIGVKFTATAAGTGAGNVSFMTRSHVK